MQRRLIVVLVALTLMAHWRIAWRTPLSDVLAGGAGDFVGSAVLGSVAVTAGIALQLGVVILLYGVSFWAIAWLARPRPGEPARLQSAAILLLMTWFAAAWLLLHFHSREFPNSAWGRALDPDAGAGAMAALDLVASAWLLWRVWRARERGAAFVWAALATTVAAYFAVPAFEAATLRENVPASKRSPDVVIIGLDSLRRDLVMNATPDTLPTLARFKERGYLQSGTVSSLARTYPSWVSLLTGRPVHDTGARENHAPEAAVDTKDSFAWTFEKAGYRTVFATDDTQFSYIGSGFGFDDILAPEPGVPNFFLTRFADSPLVNFAVQVRGMERLLPALAANRAFAQAYRPSRFVSRIADGVSRRDGRPLLLAMHLCALHWPFQFADAGDGGQYDTAVRVLDHQLGEILAMLPTIGIDPDSSIVVLLADHGDSGDQLFLEHRTVVKHSVERDPGGAVGGHGASLLDPLQWRTFMLFAGRGARGPIPHGESGQLASLDNLSATVQALAGLETVGRPLLDVAISSQPGAPRVTRDVIPLETGLRTGGLDLSNPDAKVAARIAAALYRVRPDGQTELTPAAYADAIATKDIGVTDDRVSLLSLWQPGGFLLVSEDLGKVRLDVYPAARPEGAESPPLLREACKDEEIRARHPTWCLP